MLYVSEQKGKKVIITNSETNEEKTYHEYVSYLKQNVKENDIVLTLGAGTVTTIGPMLLK